MFRSAIPVVRASLRSIDRSQNLFPTALKKSSFKRILLTPKLHTVASLRSAWLLFLKTLLTLLRAVKSVLSKPPFRNLADASWFCVRSVDRLRQSLLFCLAPAQSNFVALQLTLLRYCSCSVASFLLNRSRSSTQKPFPLLRLARLLVTSSCARVVLTSQPLNPSNNIALLRKLRNTILFSWFIILVVFKTIIKKSFLDYLLAHSLIGQILFLRRFYVGVVKLLLPLNYHSVKRFKMRFRENENLILKNYQTWQKLNLV